MYPQNYNNAPLSAPMTEEEINASTFEEAIERVKIIASILESGRADLDDSIKRYEEGKRLIRHCLQRLESAEQKIEKILNVGVDGPVQTAEIDPNELKADERAVGRVTAAKGKVAVRKNAKEALTTPLLDESSES